MRRTSMTRRGRRRRAESTAYITIKKKKIKEEEITTTTNNSNKTCSDLGAGRDGHDGHRLVVPDSLVNARRLTQVTAPGAAPTIKEAANDEDDDNGYSRSATQRAQQHCRHHVGSETPPRTARRIIFMMNADQMKCGLRSDKLCLLMKAGCAWYAHCSGSRSVFDTLSIYWRAAHYQRTLKEMRSNDVTRTLQKDLNRNNLRTHTSTPPPLPPPPPHTHTHAHEQKQNKQQQQHTLRDQIRDAEANNSESSLFPTVVNNDWTRPITPRVNSMSSLEQQPWWDNSVQIVSWHTNQTWWDVWEKFYDDVRIRRDEIWQTVVMTYGLDMMRCDKLS